MFWRRRAGSADTLESGTSVHHLGAGDTPVDAGEALDAFVHVLRAWGQFAFDLEHETAISFQQQCDAWARHLLVLEPPPALTAVPMDDEVDLPIQERERDWPTVSRFLVDRRRREQHHVNKALGDLRQGLWAFAQSLGTALIEDQRTDNRLKCQIERLQQALGKQSTEEIKNEVVSAATDLSQLVSERQRAQRARLDQLGARVTDLAGQLREAKRENVRDSLTQLVNRKGFDDFLNRVVFLRDVFGETASLLMIDADRFKVVNDTYGHPGGDAVLKALADCLVRNFPRKSDLVARYGGEEFAAILPDTSAQNSRRLAERLVHSVRELQVPHGNALIRVSISVGVAELGRGEPVQDWLARADQALYRAKAEGRNRAIEASPALAR
ncbi:MAG: GGDEF domain-containing protein [Chloroflexi bacterium]|nr:GGDEF domain-containing protein [Chloroflexota bacterium]